MQKLMERNGGEPKGFLSGEDEVKAFKNKKYVQLRQSALAKIGWFREIFKKLLVKQIKTERSSLRMKIDKFCDRPGVKVFYPGMAADGALWPIGSWLTAHFKIFYRR